MLVLARIDEAFLDIACEAVEGLLDVDVALCADFEEGDAQLVSQGLSLFCADGALLFPVAFVSDKDLVDAFAGVLLDIGEPGSDVWVWVSGGFFMNDAEADCQNFAGQSRRRRGGSPWRRGSRLL